MLVFYSILLAILLGLWAWTRRAAWSIPVAIVTVLLVATWLNFRWEVVALLVFAVIIIALAILFARVILGLIFGAIALLLAAVIGFGFVIPSITEAPKASIGAPATSAPASQPATCEAKFVQVKADYGPDNRVDGTFETAYANTVANKTGAEKENAQRELILKHSANNAQRLAIWSHANGIYANPNDWKKLAAGDCLSKEGQDLWNQLSGALNAKGTKFSEADAPQDGYNSGIVNGTFSVASAPGIASSKKAIEITRADGSKVYILVYCGNVVFDTPPQEVPTSPEVPGPPPTCPEGMSGVPPNCNIPPPPVCPPGTTGTPPNCLEIKIPSQGSGPQGNAPVGSGNNDIPGPGVFIPGPEMTQPPAVQPAPPAEPAPQPAPVGSEPAPAPNDPGPRPTAPPEPGAPEPSTAPSTCIVAPGKTSC